MKMQLLYRLIITDKNGKVEKRTHWRKSKSFVLQWLQHIEEGLTHAYGATPATVSVLDTTNTARSILNFSYKEIDRYCSVLAGVATSTYGIVVGTGSNAVSNANYALQTQIAHGVGAGQLLYGAGTYAGAAIVGANVDLVFSRTFVNGSGGDIIVTEIGMYVASSAVAGGAQSNFCIIRDLATVLVQNTKTLTVQYTFRTTA